MDLTVDEMLEGLLSKEAQDQPSDRVKLEQLALELPPWFNEKEFNKGRRFYWRNCFALSSSMLMGLLAVFAVPSILVILVGSRRSTSTYTAYKRYLSTLLHVNSWFDHELKPGSVSWKSLHAVRSRHLSSSMASNLQGRGVISQRDLALTQFGFIGFALTKPDKIGALAFQPGDWSAYLHFWRTIGYMIGIEDRYNICRSTEHETRQVCKYLLDNVFAPALGNVPEYFEHMSRVMLDGMWSANPTLDGAAALYYCKYLAGVPGYITSEGERIDLCEKIRLQLKDKTEDAGVDASSLMPKAAIDGLPQKQRLIYQHDFEVLSTSLEYSKLSWFPRLTLNLHLFAISLCTTYLGRLYFNLNFMWSLILMQYFPFLAFHRFGIAASFINIFKESPSDDSKPLTNAYYESKKPLKVWYQSLVSFFKRDI